MWRAKQVGVEKHVGFVGVDEICGCPMLEGPQMVVGVVAHLVTFVDDLLKQFRIAVDILTHHEECGFCVELFKCLEQERSGFGDGTVVERQIDCSNRRIHPPNRLWVYPSQPFGWLFNNHSLLKAWQCSAFCVIPLVVYLQFLVHLGGTARIDFFLNLDDSLHHPKMTHVVGL